MVAWNTCQHPRTHLLPVNNAMIKFQLLGSQKSIHFVPRPNKEPLFSENFDKAWSVERFLIPDDGTTPRSLCLTGEKIGQRLLIFMLISNHILE
jgi:hypothetical protein